MATSCSPYFFFFNDTATTEIYTLSLHDALPICVRRYRKATSSSALPCVCASRFVGQDEESGCAHAWQGTDRKSTRLNSSHSQISYAVFCLKKKKKHPVHPSPRTP